MKHYSIRLTETQCELVNKLSVIQDKPCRVIIRNLLDSALSHFFNLDTRVAYVTEVPHYAITSLATSLETLILLRKLAQNSAPELVTIAQNEAQTALESMDMGKLVSLKGITPCSPSSL